MGAGLPQKSSDLLGHYEAETSFLSAHASGRLHHAWLISGPRGVGKATLAFRMARFLLANPPVDADGGLFGDILPPTLPTNLDLSPDHPVFQRIAAGSHGDLMSVACSENDKGAMRTEIVVDDVRKLVNFFSKTSAEGGWRVAIVDSADELNRNAANALLKVLEEPPANAVLILLAHASGRVLPTIQSRCRRLVLRPLEESSVNAFLALRRPDLPERDRLLLTRLAEGSPGLALRLAAANGLTLYRKLLDYLGGMPQVAPRAVLELAELVTGKGNDENYAIFGLLLGGLLGRIARAASGAMITAIPEEAEVLARLAGMAGLDPWIEVWEKSTSLIQRTDAINLDRKQSVIVILNEIAAVTRF
ncbi:DNA polymerase III subunit delta' [Alphaproteobacteria bacterium LMG 31809]|uniref:DNA polymerase III subunit delta n=1 Tax=Govanella unica TaxID=2975056 RepID=A0A9X3TYR0_9PROT|nr:DNA polymerase III subunit delta' [Govania unica]